MNYNIKGTVQTIGQIQNFDKFSKIEFTIETVEDKYPQMIKFEMHNDKASNIVNNVNVGDNIDVDFNIRGREWEGKVYNNLVAWRVKPDANTGTVKTDNGVVDDNLPF